MDKQLFRVSEAADLIGFGRTKTYELINRGLLKAVLVDGVRRVPTWAIEEYGQRLREESKFVPSGGGVGRQRRPRSSASESCHSVDV